MQLVGHLDDAAGVHHVVRRVEDATVGQVLLDAGVGQLVVGRAADHLRGQRRYGLVVQRAAEGARRVHVQARRADQRPGVRRHLHLRVPAADPLDRFGAHIRDHDLRAVLEEVFDEVVAHLADARDADLAAAQRRVAPQVLRRGAHPLEDTEGGEDGGVAGAAVLGGAAGGPLVGAGDDVHVRDVRADVARGHVAAAEGSHEPAVCEQEFFGLDQFGVTDDHGLTATVVETGEGVLVRHATGEVQGVQHRLLLGGVRVEAGTAEGRAQSGVVDGDDGPQAAGAVLAEDDLLVATLLGTEQGVQDSAVGADGRRTYVGHGGDSHKSRRTPSGGSLGLVAGGGPEGRSGRE